MDLASLLQTAPRAYVNAFYSEFALLAVWLPIMILLPESPSTSLDLGVYSLAVR